MTPGGLRDALVDKGNVGGVEVRVMDVIPLSRHIPGFAVY
jgi:hypothetical protein